MGPGTVLSPTERYVISEYLTEGGMGAIYLGKRIGVGGFEKDVVLKQLLPELTSDREITELFLREARLSASLSHQNIVHTMDLIQVAGSLYMVLEYVRGADLRTLLRRARRRSKRFSPAAALLIGCDLLDALDYAHNKHLPDGTPLGLIHRDISPSNILLSAAGEVKLTDFGIAKAVTHGSMRYQVRGKVGYMSPEQARGEELDARSDLFSVAVVLYEVLAGQRLFIGDLAQSPSAVYGAPIPSLSARCPEVPAAFDAVMARALSLSRDDRYQSAREFHEALCGLALQYGMLMGHADLAQHLQQLCGPAPEDWLRDDERTGTALIAAEDGGGPGDDSGLSPWPLTPPPPAAQAGNEMTSRVWLEPEGPAHSEEGQDLTQPMLRQTTGEVGIADMARMMVRPGRGARPPSGPATETAPAPRVTGPGPTHGHAGERTSATMRMISMPEVPPLPEARGWPPRTLAVLVCCAVFLLGLGVALGMFLSGPGKR